MATNKKRVTISLSDSNAEFVLRASKVMGKPQSAVITDILTETVDVLMPVILDLERAKRGDISRSALMTNMLKVATKTTSDAQIDLLDSFGED